MQVKKRAILGQLSDADMRLLRVFKSVVDCGGMAAAELELNIGISTISKHVKDLETRLGLTLCHRGRSGFSTTAEGERIYQETQRVLAATDAFIRGVDEIHRRMGGQLNVAVFDKTASNPAARVGAAIALFTRSAPDVSLNMHVAPINTIEQGIMDGRFQVGIIPAHRNSASLSYSALFDETMLLYCGSNHPLFTARHEQLTWKSLHAYQFAGLGYHSPNMEISQKVRLARKATGFDQESIATLILSGQFLGFLPDHYARSFETEGLMRAVKPARFRYDCSFVSAIRNSPSPPRVTQVFHDCLLLAHGKKQAPEA
jgi:LysR family transcriptional regulator, transcriptional activator for bauABCD operon